MNNNSMRLNLLGAASVVALMALPRTAVAQNTDENSPSVGLDTITVTAQRKEETLQEAAIPISVATGDELKRAGIDNVGTINNVAPSLYVINGGGTLNSYFLRGVGNFASQNFVDAAVATNIDGVFVGRASSSAGAFLDLARVEVLKGPQGTLYGRNATGGAINLIPNKPELGEFGGSLVAGYGNFNAYEVTGVLNAPLGDNTAIRIAGTHIANDGQFDDGTSQTNDWAIRAQLYSELSESVNARISFDYAGLNGSGPGSIVEGNFSFIPVGGPTPGPLDAAPFFFNPAPAAASEPFSGILTPDAQAFLTGNLTGPGFGFFPGNLPPEIDSQIWGVHAEVNAATPIGDLVVIPSYRQAELDQSFNGPAFVRGTEVTIDPNEQFSIEARLSNSTGPIDWIVGAFYLDENYSGANFFQQGFLTATNVYEGGVESFAFFGRATWNLSDQFRLVGGIRYTEDERTFDGQSDVVLAICPSFAPPGFVPCIGTPTVPGGTTAAEIFGNIDPADLPAGPPMGPPVPFGTGGALLVAPPPSIVSNASLTDDEVTFRLAAEFDLTPDNMIYASFENGFRSGGFILTPGGVPFDPEFIDAYTIGSKNRFFDNRLQANIELFWWDYEDQQVSHFGVDPGTSATTFLTENIGASTIRGIDLDLLFQAGPNTLLRGNVQFLDAEADEFEFVNAAPNTLPPITGCPFTPGAAGGQFVVDCAGFPLRNSPDWSINAGIEHVFEMNDYNLTFNADGRYRSEHFVGFDYLEVQRQDGYFTADLTATFAPNDGGWFVQVYSRNVTNEAVRTFSQVGANSSNSVTTQLQPPRTYGGRIGLEF